MNTPDDAAKRAAARASWPITKTTLEGDVDALDLRATTTMEQRLNMMWRLALDAWALSGQALPDYERRNMPTRILRGGGGA